MNFFLKTNKRKIPTGKKMYVKKINGTKKFKNINISETIKIP